MKDNQTNSGLAARIWFSTSVLVGISLFLYLPGNIGMKGLPVLFIVIFASLAVSVPAFLVLLFFLSFLAKWQATWRVKYCFFLLVQLLITLLYAAIVGLLDSGPVNSDVALDRFFNTMLPVLSVLFGCTLLSSFIQLKYIFHLFSGNTTGEEDYSDILFSLFQHTTKNNFTMETTQYESQPQSNVQSNRLVIKGLVTGGLILLMLIPTLFITQLINERQSRQQEVVKEVSSKWALAQTVSGPYIYVPYSEAGLDQNNKPVRIKSSLLLLARDLNINGNVIPENRPRSIYKVLLYKTALNLKGSFKPNWPNDINMADVDFANAKLCFGLTDFKGIEEEIYVNMNGEKLLLSPGLPTSQLDEVGLSVPININQEMIKGGLAFDMQVKLKGSEQLHFMPLSANSSFVLNSSWPSPSFDGNVLPNEREVTEKGFRARWNFNQANLPFGTVLRNEKISKTSLSFGVSMVQPADQYNKTMRSVKYAILFIGLTFALFFVVEIMQKKPFHPVQYVLVGMALVIFFTLLLSISEYLLFDQAYLIAAAATVLLVTLYALSHFKNWRTAAVFAPVLSALYGFIFILIRLEDTALIVGSIGLFIVLALVMYASRKINWYGSTSRIAVQ